MNAMDFNKPEYFINRELSWLEFNDRVLKEAKNTKNPLFERTKFLSIVSSNLDEFFMIRVAGLKDQVSVGFNKPDPSGLTPKEQLKNISVRTHKMVKEQYSLLRRAIFPLLKKNAIHVVDRNKLTAKQRDFLEDYFTASLYPVLTPMAVDSSRPVPLILNKSLNIGILVKRNEDKDIEVDKDKEFIFATVQVPSVLPRVVDLPGGSTVDDGDKNGEQQDRYVIFLEEIIMMYLHRLFAGHKIICAYPYRITRNADLSIEEEEAEDLLLEIEKSVKMRRWGHTIRVEVQYDMDKRLINILQEALEIHDRDIYYIHGPLDLTFLMKMYAIDGYEHLRYPEYHPQTPQDLLGEQDIFEVISERDVFLHHPFESFEPIVEFIRKAAEDPQVLAIKQTLYRVSGNSPIIQALAEAAEQGKQVTVLVELKARFDEENNIQWAKRLEKAGCHVIYGLVGLKTHSKIAIVVRKEYHGIKRYVHLGTGNYNDITARFYTDMGIFTSNEYFGADASAVFNMLSGYSKLPALYKLITAPLDLRSKFLELIDNEIQKALSGRKGRIIAKMNSLVDSEIIKALYRASVAGVSIDLVVRGICCLRPGMRGISENITVRSIIGRFLEHSRVYYFYNDGRKDIFLSSADWMPRNLDRRVELLFPIEDKRIKDKIVDIFNITLDDTVKARISNQEGKYRKIDGRGKPSLHSQEYFCNLAMEQVNRYNKEKNALFFEKVE